MKISLKWVAALLAVGVIVVAGVIIGHTCRATNGIPSSRCTPGDTLPVSLPTLCATGYSSTVRDVTDTEKVAIYGEYGFKSTPVPGKYEIDHLIPLSIGGSNDPKNLWPEAAAPTPGYHEKDATELHIYSAVCKGQVGLATAQFGMAKNWKQYYTPEP